jgi:hypothetical protein
MNKTPQLHLFRPWQTALHALRGHNINSSPRASLQRVFVRSKTPLHAAPLVSTSYGIPLHVQHAYVSWHPLGPSHGHRPRRTFSDEAAPDATLTGSGPRSTPRDPSAPFCWGASVVWRSRHIFTFGTEGPRPSGPPRVVIVLAKHHSPR